MLISLRFVFLIDFFSRSLLIARYVFISHCVCVCVFHAISFFLLFSCVRACERARPTVCFCRIPTSFNGTFNYFSSIYYSFNKFPFLSPIHTFLHTYIRITFFLCPSSFSHSHFHSSYSFQFHSIRCELIECYSCIKAIFHIFKWKEVEKEKNEKKASGMSLDKSWADSHCSFWWKENWEKTSSSKRKRNKKRIQ